MSFQPVPNTARFAIVYDGFDAVTAINVFYFRNDSLWGLPELTTATGALEAAWSAYIMPSLSFWGRVLRVEARGERGQEDVSFQLVLNPPVAGGQQQEALPYQCAVCITHLTGFTGRNNRGRSYIPFIPENRQNRGILEQSFVDNLVNGLGSVRTEMSNAGWQHVVVSRFLNKVKRVEGYTRPVIGYRARDYEVDTQRRRTRANAP